MLKTLEDCKLLLKIENRGEPSEDDKARTRHIWKTDVTNAAKVYYHDYFMSLDQEEQDKIKEFWGFTPEKAELPPI